MKVILLDNVAKIGQKFEIKNVSDGYALNFLIPKGLAKPATGKTLKEAEAVQESLKEKMKQKNEEIIEGMRKLKDSTININAKVNKEGGLFAGIDKKEIVIAIKDQKALNIKEENIILDKPIKEAIEHTITITADGDSATFKLNIIPTE